MPLKIKMNINSHRLTLEFIILSILLLINAHLNALSISPNTTYPPNNPYSPNIPYNPNIPNTIPNTPIPNSPNIPINTGPLIIDMVLASPDDDPEPYIIEYIQGKEKTQVRKLRVLGAPDTSSIFFAAYQTFLNQQCRNIWLVRVSLSENMAQGLARVISCDQAVKENILKIENKRTVLNYSSIAWPK